MSVESLTLCKHFCCAKCGTRPAGICLIPLHRREGLPLAQWWRCPPAWGGFKPSRTSVIHGYQHSRVILLNKREHWLFMLLRSPQESQRGICKMAKCWLLPNPEQNSHRFQWTQLFILRFQGWVRLLNILPKTPMSNHSSTHHPQICSWTTAVVPNSPVPHSSKAVGGTTSLTHSLKPTFLFAMTKAGLCFAWQRYLLIMDGRLLVSETSPRKLPSPALNVSGSKEPMHALKSSFSG